MRRAVLEGALYGGLVSGLAFVWVSHPLGAMTWSRPVEVFWTVRSVVLTFGLGLVPGVLVGVPLGLLALIVAAVVLGRRGRGVSSWALVGLVLLAVCVSSGVLLGASFFWSWWTWVVVGAVAAGTALLRLRAGLDAIPLEATAADGPGADGEGVAAGAPASRHGSRPRPVAGVVTGIVVLALVAVPAGWMAYFGLLGFVGWGGDPEPLVGVFWALAAVLLLGLPVVVGRAVAGGRR